MEQDAPDERDRDLVDRARHDVEAFAELYRRNVNDVHSYVARRCGSTAIADDVTAIAFERALRNLHSFRWRSGGFRGWVFRIAANELVDHHRRLQAARRRDVRLAAFEFGVVADAASDLVEHDDPEGAATATLRVALAQLRPRHQEAISLRYLAGLSHAEAAATMGISNPTFAVTLHRAISALRAQLKDQQ